jgi:O-antigen ligase
MLELRSKQILGTVTLVAVAAVTLVVAPYTLLDPMGLPKLSMLAFFAVVAMSLMAPAIKNLFSSGYRTLVILLTLFIFQITLVLLFSGANISTQFFGVHQRQTGALTYISLTFLLLSASLVSDYAFLKRFIRLTLIVGTLLILYGNIQYLGFEPFPYDNAYTVNAPIGTFGNPDFQSAFMGIIAVVSFTMALNKAFKPLARFGLAIMGFASIIVIYETLAKQGYLNFIAGAGVVTIAYLFMKKRNSLGIALGGLGALGGGLVFLGLINAGPLANLLYKSSLTARGYYWSAAVKMLTGHPFFGVGMDGFGDWYLRVQPAAYFENGYLSFSNAAHNVYLDIASSGGFPLIAIYLAILALVIVSIAKVVKRSDGFDVYFVAIVGAWVAYQTQAFVSINQIGLAIWGWVLSGLIIGYEINTRVNEMAQTTPVKRNQQIGKGKSAVQPLSSTAVMSVFAGILIGALIAAPLFLANARFFAAIKANDIKAVESAGNQQPHDQRRMYMLAGIFRNANLDAKAIQVLKEATAEYPDSHDLWNLWLTIPTASAEDLATARAQLKRLDPFNPDIK